MDQTTRLLRDLIAIPSVNPAFAPARSPYAGEQRMADFVAAVGARAGLDVEVEPVFPRRPNVLMRLRPAGAVRQRVLLLAHLDTVGGTPLSAELFKPSLSKGRLHGRGACDTKGCVAAILTALGQMARHRVRPVQTELLFAAVIDEENGQAGSRALVADGLQADLAIVGEPTRLEVVTAHKGSLWLCLSTQGRAAHGSRPELGHNAIHDMARLVDCLQTEYAQALRRRRHPLLRAPTINVGTIAGGVQPNVVPAACEILVDRRTLPGETEVSVRRELQSLLRRQRLSARITNVKNGVCESLETEASLPLVRQFLHANGGRPPAGVDYFCDASVLSQGGIPSVVFGPGDIAQAHTADEWIALKSLTRGVAILLRFLQSLP